MIRRAYGSLMELSFITVGSWKVELLTVSDKVGNFREGTFDEASYSPYKGLLMNPIDEGRVVIHTA